jgi:hypothetical protein
MELVDLDEKKSISKDEEEDTLMKLGEEKKSKKRKVFFFVGFGMILAMIAMIAIIGTLIQNDPAILEQTFASSITLTTPVPFDAHYRDDIVIDVIVNEIPNREFPAASISVNFDRHMLEFIGLRQGDMVTRGRSGNYDIPIWHVDIDASNEHGIVNAMYLDTTGSQYPYIINDADVLLRLVFRLQDDGAQDGKVHHIVIDDAVLAAVDPLESVGVALGNLRAHHAQIIVK